MNKFLMLLVAASFTLIATPAFACGDHDDTTVEKEKTEEVVTASTKTSKKKVKKATTKKKVKKKVKKKDSKV